jgi:two-component system, OmpR family, sensor histidine kinase MprB
MTLRLRMAATAAGAVTVVVVVSAVAVYLAVRSDLRGEVDRVLAEQAQPLTVKASGVTVRVARNFGIGGIATGAVPRRLAPPKAPLPGKRAMLTAPPGAGHGESLGGAPRIARQVAIEQGPPQPFTGAGGYIQFLRPDGSVAKSANEGSLPSIPPSAAARAIAARGTGRELADVQVGGEHMRVLTLGVGPGGAVQLARPLTEVDNELSNLVVILVAVGAAGILLAALLGAVVARTALAPIARFTRRTEGLAATAEARQRLQVDGRDELARLASSFNRTLDELERSVQAQRQLVADASHELRTPIASLRANIQVLEQAERLPASERESLRRDVIAELDELTGLVSDLVELARGAKPSAVLDEVRLDELVSAAVSRAQRRSQGASFHLEIEPTLVSGDAARIDRAVANLLDNALQWSPPGSVVEVTLHDGALSVRDHGPGFAEGDLPHVFARFYRADGARGKPGSGLGLAIVKQAAEAHDGHVEAANAAGGGARVTVAFGAPTRLLQLPDTELMQA